MKIYDVTVPLRPGMPTYAGTEPGPRLQFHSLIKNGDSANVSELHIGSHTGTHVDAPDHFLDNGVTVEQMPVGHMVGPAWVAKFPGDSHIAAADLAGAGIPPGTTRLLVKTRNVGHWDETEFRDDFIGFDDDAGPWLAERGFVLVGIDYMSIERFRSPTHAVHVALLERGIAIIEGLELRDVHPGEYFLVCAPLPVVGADGAPARVLLLEGVSAD
jgi:arylformamidase